MLYLRILGPTELADASSEAVDALARQPKRLALVAYLAITTVDGFRRRDMATSLFWPELDQARARTYLRKSLYGIREGVGTDLVVTRGEDEVRVDPSRLWCDAVALPEHCAAGRWADALALYRGELLEGIYPEGVGSEFQDWLDAQRRRLRGLAAHAAREVARTEEARGDLGAAVSASRRAQELEPDSEEGIRQLMDLLDRRGDRGGALRVYTEWGARLFEEYGVEPAPETRRIANRVRAARKGESHETPPPALVKASQPARSPPDDSESSSPTSAGLRTATERDSPPRRVPALLRFGIVVIALVAMVWWQFGPQGATIQPLSIAVLPLRAIDPLAAAAAAGMTEELTTVLAADSQLPVRSATHASSLLDQGLDVDVVGQRLAVSFVLDGGVQTSLGGFRLTLRLLRAEDALVVWAGTYEYAAEDGERVSREIARQVAARLMNARR